MTTTRYKDRPPTHKTRYVSNQSSRRGVKPVQICIHSTESQDIPGWDDLNSLTAWFDNPASQASAHIGVDGDGNSVQWVPSANKAWTCLDANPFTLNLELVGRAAQPEAAWEDAQVRTAARWCAFWCLQWDIPVQRGLVGNSHGVCYPKKPGFIGHIDVTRAGFGTHVDPGGFPMTKLLRYVRYYVANGWTLG